MALKHIDSGRYIKIVRDRTEFRPNSVTVYYYEFASKADRDEYFARKQAIAEFVAQGDAEFNSTDAVLFEMFKERGIDSTTIKTVEELPEDMCELIYSSERLRSDLDMIRFSWDSEDVLKWKFKDRAALDARGFQSKWLEPLPPWSLNGLETGVYTNQTFSYDSLYRELKKVFKDGYIDC